MKRIIAIILCAATIFSCVGTAVAKPKTEKVTMNELIDCYYQCLKVSNPSMKMSQARSYLVNSMGSGFFSRSLKKTSPELCTRAKKIVAFYNEANQSDFTNLYHPNSDLSVNEDDILELKDLKDDSSLCIMLFGNQLKDDGTMSDKFLARCKTALAMAEKYPHALIMVTGGHTAGYKYDSEAEVGRDWLVKHGVDKDRIVIDPISWDTFANVLCTFTTSDLSKHKEIENFVVVSSDYHVPKCSIFLMTYIYAFGYDLPKSRGGRNYKYLGNLGAVLG